MAAIVAMPAGGAPAPSALAGHLSPSQVACYIDCGAAYWFKYGLKLAEVRTGSRALGTAIHETLAYALEQKRDGLAVEAADVEAQFGVELPAALEDAQLGAKETREGLARDGRGLIAKWIDEQLPLCDPAGVEVEASGAIGGVAVACVLDVIERNGRIRDFKTAKSNRGLSSGALFQLASYVQIAGQCAPGKRLPEPSGVMQVDALIRTKTPQVIALPHLVTSADIEHTRVLYPLVQEAIRAGYFVPNRGSHFCSREQCSYWRECQGEFGGTVA